MKKFFVLLLLFFVFQKSYTQNILEDKDGKSVIDFSQFKGGIFTVNTADQKIQFDYVKYNYTHKYGQKQSGRNWYGVSLSGNANNNISNLFDEGRVNPGFATKLKYGRLIFHRAIEMVPNNVVEQGGEALQNYIDNFPPQYEGWLVFNIGYQRDEYGLYDASRSFSEQFYDTISDGITASLALNFWHAQVFNSVFVGGISLGFEKGNNYNVLGIVEAEDVRTTYNADSSVTRTIRNKRSGAAGGFVESDSYSINTDFYFAPHGQNDNSFIRNLSFGMYTRTYFIQDFSNSTNLGFGAYLLRDKNPMNAITGISIEISDVFDQQDLENRFGKRIALSLLASLSIPFGE